MSKTHPVTEARVMRVFRAHRDRLLRELGRQALYGDQIDAVGRREFGQRWGGVSDQSGWRPHKNRFYVVNTARTPTSPGVHWVAIYVSPAGTSTIYDSFGRDPRKLMWTAVRAAKKGGGHAVGTDPTDAEQRGASQVCGVLSLAWLLTVRDLGVRAARLV
jgi:hypothetical protein